MKNKKLKIAFIGLMFGFLVGIIFGYAMLFQLKISTTSFNPSNWFGLWSALLTYFVSILGAFGAANHFDKKTIINKPVTGDDKTVSCFGGESENV